MIGAAERSSLQAHLEVALPKEPWKIRPVLLTSHTSRSPAGHRAAADLSASRLPVLVAHEASTTIRSIATPALSIGKARLL
jgi:hypothetical protein